MSEYWEKGGVFNTFKDYALGTSLLLLPIVWLCASYKLYKYGVVKFLTTPIIKIYRKITAPKEMDVEHISIKNLGSKDRTLDEIISDKRKEMGEDTKQELVSKNLRKQISAKIGEN